MRIGSVPYLNALPLCHGLDLVTDTPRHLKQRLVSGELDLALLSTVVLFEDPTLYLVPGMGIGCKGPVQSVKLFFNKSGINIHNISGFNKSPESNTANILAQVLVHVEANPGSPKGQGEADLVIGDAALLRPEPFGAVDLGQWWWERTGLPFVFAAWISRHPTLSRSLWETLMATKAHNLANLDACIERSPLLPELSQEAKCHYLRHHIHYELGDIEISGLQAFRSDCITSNILPEACPIQFAKVTS